MKFVELIERNNFAKGEDLESEALIVAQKVLCNMGLDMIPRSYADFLRKYNGIKYDGIYLFGATVDDDMDIIDKNEQMDKPENTILLGYNEFDLLCYDFKSKQYKIVDRSDFEVLDTYEENEIDEALTAIFNAQ
ncbi:MAG: YrhA family protein [Alphaproteobacteria bacterium]|nr:YrhA family protein [Alphaproteobacteria bacterium]